MVVDIPDLPDEREIELENGSTVTVRETIDQVEVEADRRKQLDQYEPIEEGVTLTATKPEPGLEREQFDEWVEALADIAWKEAERGVMTRFEQYARKQSFGD